MAKMQKNDVELIRSWTLSVAATLGSAVRAKGILQEIQARLPATIKKSLTLAGNDLTLVLPQSEKAAFQAAVAVVSKVLDEAEALPVIPREIQDILGIKTSERHRWLADGRLPSAGTRTVRLNGRARRITFHVFDPKVVEDLLDRGAVDEWRVEDAEAKVLKKERDAELRRMTRMLKQTRKARTRTGKSRNAGVSADPAEAPEDEAGLRGWDDFGSDGLLR
ncbi:hypothetical protein [Rhizobium sp. SSA_523]|uniref:hypothetical protein n=1 Tax=Rhizobium sp. SSA_523 TaxID=2952477 RepID=UPI0020918A4D|nr:hypothetical protein [Rhizobium sp. SSA_523]MCO5732087.1 hypothetical protein [Rhizobium sp. SSA_523]WKC25665.1 hypothetical protein QTJ18_17085 [Rhizobium sp. SSA_523]